MKLKLNQKVNSFKNQRLLGKIRGIFKLCLIIGGFLICLVSILISSSLSLIFRNIDIPDGNVEFNLDFSHYSKIEETSVKIPYRIINKGFLAIDRMFLKISIDVSYTENLLFSETREMIFYKQEVLGHCQPGKSISGVFEGDYHDLNMTALANYLNKVYRSKEEVFLMKLELDFYLIGGYYFRFILKNIDIDGGFCNECAG